MDRPPVSGPVDWGAVNRWRVTGATSEGSPASQAGLTPEELPQALSQKSFIEGRRDLVLDAWRSRPWEPVGSVENVVLAEALAEKGDERATASIERLRGSHPVEADLLLGRLRWRQGRSEEAVEALETAFVGYREDPWPMTRVVVNTFPIALDLAAKETVLAVRLSEALAHPFAVALLDDERLLTRLRIAARVDAAHYVEALQKLEPNVPWSEAILKLRARAYEQTGDPRAALARREFEEFERLKK
jgi:hypothetical protein